jgi:hypothetical protein
MSNALIDKDFNSFMKGSLDSLIGDIDVDYSKLIPRRSELFVQKVLKDYKGNLVVNEPVHDVMHRFVRFARARGFNKVMILGAFGHGKTEQMCIGYTLYEIARNPNIQIKLVHVSDDEAVKRCRTIRDYITMDDDFKKHAPHVIPTSIWGSQRFIVNRKFPSKDGTVEAYGILSTAIGGRANLIIFDDPQDLKSAVFEPTTRKKIEDTFKNIWLTRLIPEDSEVILMMNKWHENDLASHIQNNPIWAWMSIAASERLDYLLYEDSFGRKFKFPIWSKFNSSHLLMKKKELGERDFDRGYRLIPYSDSDKTFSSYLKCCHFGVNPRRLIENESDWIFVGGVDFSSLKRPGTVISVIAAHRQTGMKLPVALSVLRGSSDVVSTMITYHKEFGIDTFWAENNGVQDAIIDMLVSQLGEDKYKKYHIKIEGFLTGRNKADPLVGLPSLDREFANKEWMFCYQNEPTIESDLNKDHWARMHFEMKNHPFYETSDIVMSMWFAREGIKTYFRGGSGPNIY